MPRKPAVKNLILQKASNDSAHKSPNVLSRKNFNSAVNSNYLEWRDIVPGITVRNTSSEDSYYQFRESEKLPTTPKGLIALGMSYYKKNPIVKNTFDTMAEFAANGMVVPHKSELIQEFYKNWLKKIGFYQINEQFVRILFKAGVVPIHRSFAKINKATVKEMNLGLAADQDFPKIDFVKTEIPIGYSFLNPLYITLPQERIAIFTGKRNYHITMPEDLISVVKQMTKTQLEEFAAEFPPDIAKSLRLGITEIPLDPKKTSIYHYKKDDFEVWGEPVHACIFDDLMHYDKVKLADRTTLDSIASRIRLWQLGHLDKEYSIFPDDGAYEKLNELLASIPSGGVADVIWGPAIKVDELSKDAYQFLGTEKYRAPLNAIYQGLGVPRTVNDDNSFNNSYFGLKTMVERLNYARNILKEFWDEEFKMVHKSMGFAGSPPSTFFDEISITDKSQMMALVRDLCDRNVISEQEVQRLFNTDPDIESYRIKKQHKRQTKGTYPPKTGPFSTNEGSELRKIALTKGIVKPSDVGVESTLSDKQIMDIVKPKPAAPKGQPGQGRPKNSADKKVRKKRIVKPRSAMASIWYMNAQSKIHDIVLNQYLQKDGKKNYRSLSTSSSEGVELDTFAVLYNIEYGAEITQDSLNGVNNKLSEEVLSRYNTLIASFVKEFGRTPNIDEQRVLQIETCLEKE